MKRNSSNPTRRKALKGIAGLGALTTIPPAVAEDGHPTVANTIPYRDLTREARAAFAAALNQGALNLGRPGSSPRQLLTNDYVKKGNTTHDLRLHGRFVSKYGGDIQRATAAKAEPQSTVEYTALGEQARRAFKSNLGKGTGCLMTRRYPEALVDNQFIEYKGTLYSTNPDHRDAVMNTLEVGKI